MDIPRLRGKGGVQGQQKQKQKQKQEQNGDESEVASATVARQFNENMAALSPSAVKTGGESEQAAEQDGDKPKRKPKTNGSVGSAPASPAPRRVPTYKIALASSFLPHGGGRRSASSAAAQS